MDFLNYWDTRIDANERFFNNYPQLANFTFRECNRLWDHLYSDYAALLARHNALVEALREAVAWERDCNDASEVIYDDDGAKYDGEVEFENILSAARAEVDRLIVN